MSPTMTEGGIAGWKKQEGEAFTAGDVLLEIETDKATIDVEAQDDGILGKILVKDGSSKIPVGQIIAILAEEGDDLSAIEVPSNLAPEGESSGSSSPEKEESKKEEAAPAKSEAAPAPAPKKEETKSTGGGGGGHGHKTIKHPKPLFASVSRLLLESDLTTEQISKLKGTGRNGMLTKGDVLKATGKIQNAWGSAEKLSTDPLGPSGRRASESKATTPSSKAEKPQEPLTAGGLRRAILRGMDRATVPPAPIVPHLSPSLPLSSDYEFDSVIAPYASLLPPSQPKVSLPDESLLLEMESKGLPSTSRPKKDAFAGLY